MRNEAGFTHVFQIAGQLKPHVFLQEELADIDRPEDLPLLEELETVACS